MHSRLQLHTNQGFTLIELLTVISIISLLANMVIAANYVARQKARDIERVSTIKEFEKALEIFYQDKDRYPSAGGYMFDSWTYYPVNSDGTCGATPIDKINDLRADNSASTGFIDELYPKYFSKAEWTDPLNVDSAYNSLFNCRYIVLTSETDPAGDGIGPGNDDDSNVQRYVIHCGLETSFEYSQTDGGSNDILFEVQKPVKWLCIVEP